ncbi:MAG: hypothetical protein JWO93_3082, partial [Micrococcaceae bacterium]|nr:hypothetical protein [Micrococcaceae bacterium]
MKNRLRTTLACLLLGATTLVTFPTVAQAAPSPAPDTVPVVTADGTPAPVHFFDSPPPDLGTGTGKGSGTTPSSSSPSAEVQGGTGLARTGNIKVTLITAQLADRSAGDTAAISIEAAKSSIASASRYWQTMSNGRLSMSVGSVRTGVQTSATSGQSYAQIMSTLTRELGWVSRPYEAMVIFIPTGSLSGGALGAGWSSDATGGRILMPLPGPYTDSVVSHEFGHVLGLMHADSLQCGSGVSDVGGNGSGGFADSSCSIREYGDTMDLMGATRSIMPAISSSFWDYGGFGRGDEILDAGTAVGTKSYTLSAWAGTAARRAVKFTDPVSGETYYLELRLPVGYDTEAAQGGNRGVKIVQQGGATAASSLILMPSTKPFPGYYATNHAWQAGQTFTTHAGTSVSIDWISDTAASVTVRSKSPYASYFKYANMDAIYGKRDDGSFKALDWQEYSSLGTPAFAT